MRVKMHWMFALLGFVCCAMGVHAQTYVIELPLAGQALTLTEHAQGAFVHGDRAQAKTLIAEAFRLRPDAKRIQTLRAKIEKKHSHHTAASSHATFLLVKNDTRKRHSVKPKTLANHPVERADAQTVYDLIKGGNPEPALAFAVNLSMAHPNDRNIQIAHVNALFAAGKQAEADTAVNQVISQFGMDDTLLVLREGIRRQLAESSTYRVYRALENDDALAAIQAAKDAIVYAPDVMDHRLLFIQILMKAGQYEDAERSATQAILIDPDDVLPWMLRAYALQYLGQRAAAVADFKHVLTGFDLTANEQKLFRVIMADAALASSEPETALELLRPLAESATDANENMVIWHRRSAVLQLSEQSSGAIVQAESLRPLSFTCRISPYGRECSLLPAMLLQDPAYAMAEQTYTAIQAKNYPLAVQKARLAVQLDANNSDYQSLLINALVLNNDLKEADQLATLAITPQATSAQALVQRGEIRDKLGQRELAAQDYSEALKMDVLPLAQTLPLLAKINRKAEARDRLAQALKAGEKPVASDLDLAYLAIHVGDDEIANDAFKRSDDAGLLTVLNLQDAAYVAIRGGLDQRAIAYLSRAVDTLSPDPPLELQDSIEIQSLLNLRRMIAELSRSWGASMSVSYRGGIPSAGGIQSNIDTDQSVQIGSELYWRPFGYQNGKPFEVYARAFETPSNSVGGLVGSESLQGSVGMRWKPLTDASLIFVLGHLFPVDSKVNSDWLAQVAYSAGVGGEFRTDTSSWETQQYYAEAGRYLQHSQNYASGNVRWGRSFRLDGISPDLLAFPHAVLVGDYNSDYAERSAVGIGLGIQLRYGLRQDTYNAHRSYFDFSLQHRTSLQGNEERAKGTFLTMIMSY